jgi:predicted SprT family Zn-dependent metalloprotease
LGLADNLIINIQDTSINTKGFFMPSNHKNHYENTHGSLNYICISSLYLKEGPYETIAHELAHYINELENHKSKGNYHTKYFKTTAEKLLLKVSKGQHGFNITEETPEFKLMLEEYEPSQDAFKIYQHKEQANKKGSRNLLFMCSCGCKIRTAKNEDKPLKAVCGYCNSFFEQIGGED